MNMLLALTAGLVMGIIESIYLQKKSKWNSQTAWFVGLISGITIWGLIFAKFL
ncbi:MAG: hypothetical protein ACE5K4_02810 [Candidatus Hydrothermarchaeota archaeon]